MLDDEPLLFIPLDAQGFVLEQFPFLPIFFAAQGFLMAHGFDILEACDIHGLHGVAAKTGTVPAAKLIKLTPASVITADLAFGFFCMVPPQSDNSNSRVSSHVD